MSAPEIGKHVETRRLKRGQDVPCDGRIYWDEDGQGWFGIRHPLLRRGHYMRLLAEVAKYDKERANQKLDGGK